MLNLYFDNVVVLLKIKNELSRVLNFFLILLQQSLREKMNASLKRSHDEVHVSHKDILQLCVTLISSDPNIFLHVSYTKLDLIILKETT